MKFFANRSYYETYINFDFRHPQGPQLNTVQHLFIKDRPLRPVIIAQLQCLSDFITKLKIADFIYTFDKRPILVY